MRVPGPRTVIRYFALVSLLSLVLFLYIIAQTLPLAIRPKLIADDLNGLPLIVTAPHLIAESYRYRADETENLGIPGYADSSLGIPGIERLNGESANETESWSSELKFDRFVSNGADQDDVVYKLATTSSTRQLYGADDRGIGGAALGDPGVPSQPELNDYLMNNYRINLERGMSRFSLGVTEEMIEQGPLKLPELLPNLPVPCWVEDIPNSFTYKDNIYHCHINNRRIKAGFQTMLSYYQQREHDYGFKWRIRCLPSFYLIGVAKCGTTDLFEALTRHPQVLRPDLKEPEFWPYLRFGLNDLILNMTCARDKGRATFAEYLDTFDLTSEMVKDAIRKNENNSLHANVFFGDYSTHTFIDIFDGDKTQDAPEKINADHIYNVWPKSKFIIILRDPIDRAYSRYKMRLARQDNVAGTPADFHKRVLKQVDTTTECLRYHSRRFCVYKATYGKDNLGTNALVNTGLYAIYLKDWLRVFPLDQFLIIKFEDYIHNRTNTIERIAKFLGMDPLPPAYRSIIDSMAVMNPGRDIGGVLPETREALQRFYRPFNAELAEIVGDPAFRFGY